MFDSVLLDNNDFLGAILLSRQFTIMVIR